jgi:predicted transcriptional regulator of viral defense system
LISEKEKTITDCLDHPEYCGDITKVVKALKAEGLFFTKTVDHTKKDGKCNNNEKSWILIRNPGYKTG